MHKITYFLSILCPFFAFASPTVDRILSEMSLEEKVGQLFVAPVCPLLGEAHQSQWLNLLERFHIGNAILKQSDPETQIAFLNGLQTNSTQPLLILADAEWGLGMRMSGTISFPRNMTLGAIQDLSLLERLGEEIARQARLVGIHMNLAPVVDNNTNPKNPVIHTRAFGDNPQDVAERGARLICGLRKGGIYPCPKHFPGHGDTEIDSHFGLPKSAEQPLEPFKKAIEEGTPAIMTAHILVPSLDPNLPATLSFPILTSLLREELHFSGLIITDALNMKALTAHFSAEEIARLSHAAGADLLLYGDHISSEVDAILNDQIPRAYQALLDFYRDRPVEQLDASVRRILQAKEAMGLFEVRTVEKNPDLNTEEALALKERLFQEAITQFGDPFPPIDEHTAHLTIGGEKPAVGTSQTVVWVRGLKNNEKNFGLRDEDLALCRDLASNPNVIFCLFGSPYALSLFPSAAKILVAYEDDEAAHRAVWRILKGEKQAVGRLPISSGLRD